MDGDFSHHPRYISDFFMAIKHCDVVIGSRMISQCPASVGKVFYYCLQQGFLIKEIPILFEDRSREKSKLNLRIF
jgi:hypothetical protein